MKTSKALFVYKIKSFAISAWRSCRSALNLGGAAAPPYRRQEEFCPPPMLLVWTLAAMAFSANVRGQMFPIVTNDTAASGISVACAGTNYLVGIQGDFVKINNYQITAQLFGPAGTPIGSRISPVPGHTGGNPHIASCGTNFLMVWPDDYLTGATHGINAQIITPSGGLAGGWFAIVPESANQPKFSSLESVAYGGGKYLVVWDDDRFGTNLAIFGQLISTGGSLIGGNFLICPPANGHDAKSASVASDGTNFLVVWQCNTTSGGDHNVTYGVFVSPLGAMGTPFAIGQTVSLDRNPISAVFNGTNYLVAWNYDSQRDASNNAIWNIYGRFVTPAGSFTGSEFAIIANGSPYFPGLAYDGTNYLLSWIVNLLASNSDVEFQFLNAAAQPVGTPFTPFSAIGSEAPIVSDSIYDGHKFVSIATLSADGMTPTNDSVIYGAFISANATPQGALQMTLTGGGSGAEWQVDASGTYLKSGVTVSNLAAGSHTVSFKPVSGWNTPSNQTVTISAGAVTKAAGVYTTKEAPVLTVTSPKSGASVTSSQLTVAGTVKDDVAVASVNYQLNGGVWSPAAIAGTGTNWTQTVTLTPGSNTVSLCAEDIYGNLSLTNSLGVFYSLPTPLSVTVNGPGAVSPNYNNSNLVIGKPYTMTASPAAGCKLTNWTISVNSSTPVVSNALKLNFTMAAGMSITANFIDTTAPAISVTTPASTTVSNSVVTLSGKAADNVGVQSVYYTINSGPVNGAVITTNGYANWTAALILSPGTNVARFYAADAATNISLPATVTLVNQSGGFAPRSFSGLNLIRSQVTPHSDSPISVFFGMSTFAYVYDSSNFYAGDYVFSMLDPNTVQLSHQAISPIAGDAGSLTLMFGSSTNGTYTNSYGDGGTFVISGATGAAPPSVDGAALRGIPETFSLSIKWLQNDDGGLTYYFTNGTFSFSTSPGNVAGIYTWALYSPQMALLTATYTNAEIMSATNYILLDFADNSYDYEWVTPMGVGYCQGPFSLAPAATAPAGYAPESLAGLSVAATSVETETDGTVERGTSEISFGTATTGEIDTRGTNYYGQAGNYTYTRTGANTGLLASFYTTPPPQAGPGGGALTFTSPTSGNFTNGNHHGSFTVSQQAATAPAALVGTTLTFTPAPTSQGSVKVVAFGCNTLTNLGGGEDSVKSYIYGQYGPQAAQLQNWDEAKTNYITLWFATPSSGNFVVTQVQSGDVTISNGTFKSP
jgi:hypothetical protein